MKITDEDKVTLAMKAISPFLEEQSIFGYDDHIASILRGKPDYYVERDLALAEETYPSVYMGWREDSEYNMLDKYFEWEGILGYTDQIWGRFQSPEEYFEAEEPTYQVELSLFPKEVEEIETYYPVRIVSQAPATGLHPSVKYYTIEGDRESLLGVVRMLQGDDVELMGGDDADDDDIVDEYFKLVDNKARDEALLNIGDIIVTFPSGDYKVLVSSSEYKVVDMDHESNLVKLDCINTKYPRLKGENNPFEVPLDQVEKDIRRLGANVKTKKGEQHGQ